jgi:KAP family P-loop domain
MAGRADGAVTTAAPTVSAAGPDDLLDRELVDSRSLEAVSEDRFRHADLVAELASLVCTVPAPANVALFAPWGSGKSGMGNLLATALKDRPGVRFVRFDASKYGQAPLRRHFISQVAKALGKHDDAFSRDLYRNIDERDVTFPAKELPGLVIAFVLTLLVVIGTLCAIALFVSAVSSGGVSKNWSHTVKDYLLPALPVALVGAIFIKMATGGIIVKSTRSAPSGDEEFERLFRHLVEKVKAERIVVFVDELDRCSPVEVASTLETIKTFLEVERCVFIVAADHQVLEQALRKRARQQTPTDPTNPYYSAGSSYLDKIFQYQYQLPPLKSRRLTDFAFELVRERAGVWQRVENLPEAVSVLIPTHVTSPRRVKVLLNSFALTYRLAERRAREGVLDSHLPARASEMAKLVCLRCEFPLFAEDLSIDARLPSLVQTLADGDEISVPVRPEVRALAEEYAQGVLPVTELLIEDEGDSSRPDEDLALDPDEPEEVDGAKDGSGRETSIGAVGGEYAKQLVRYLRKVSYILGPAADLIYLESAGAMVGLDPEVADDLERAAVDGDQALVLELVTPLDEPGRRAAVWLLAGLVREAPVGVEGQNVLSTLLGTLSHTSLRLEQIAGDVANAVAGHQGQLELRPQDYSGALILGLASGGGVGSRLRDEVLRTIEALGREDVAATALCGTADIPLEFNDALGVACLTLLTGTSDDSLIEALLAISDEQAVRVLTSAHAPVHDALQRSDAASPEDTADATETDESESTADVSESDLVEIVTRRLDSLQTRLGESAMMKAMAAATTLALRSGQVPIEQTTFKHLEKLAPIQDRALGEALLDTAPGYVSSAWTDQIGRFDVTTLKTLSNVGERLGQLGSKLWRRSMVQNEHRDSDDRRAAGLAALKKVVDGGAPFDKTAVVQAVDADLAGAFVTNADVDAQNRMLAVGAEFVTAGLLDEQTLADLDLACSVATLNADRAPEQPDTEQVPQTLYSRLVDASSKASVSAIDGALAAIPPSSWLSEPSRASLSLLLGAARRRLEPATETPVSPEQLAELRAQHGDLLDPAIAAWIRAFDPAPADLWSALGDLATGPLPDSIATALRERAAHQSAREKFDAAQPALADSTRSVGYAFLRAIRFSEADQTQAAAAIIRVVSGEDVAMQQWETALGLWGELKPTGQPTQERLIRSVYLPAVRLGREGVDIAISHFGLVAHQRSKERSEIEDALSQAAADDDQRARVVARLKEAGWLKRGGPFGLGSVKKTEDSPR